MSAVTAFSRTAANNNSAAPNGWPEGQAASTINDCARELMKAIVDEATNNACKVLASVAGTNTITASCTPDITAYSGGMLLEITPAATNTGATTLNVDSVGAVAVTNIDGTACVGGELVIGIKALVMLNDAATAWIIVNPNVLKSRGLEAGLRYQIVQSGIVASATIAVTDDRGVLYYQGSGGHTFTFPASGVIAGTVFEVSNIGTGTLSLAKSSNFLWLNGSGTVGTGTRTLAIGGNAVIQYVNTGSDATVKGVGLT